MLEHPGRRGRGAAGRGGSRSPRRAGPSRRRHRRQRRGGDRHRAPDASRPDPDGYPHQGRARRHRNRRPHLRRTRHPGGFLDRALRPGHPAEGADRRHVRLHRQALARTGPGNGDPAGHASAPDPGRRTPAPRHRHPEFPRGRHLSGRPVQPARPDLRRQQQHRIGVRLPPRGAGRAAVRTAAGGASPRCVAYLARADVRPACRATGGGLTYLQRAAEGWSGVSGDGVAGLHRDQHRPVVVPGHPRPQRCPAFGGSRHRPGRACKIPRVAGQRPAAAGRTTRPVAARSRPLQRSQRYAWP